MRLLFVNLYTCLETAYALTIVSGNVLFGGIIAMFYTIKRFRVSYHLQ